MHQLRFLQHEYRGHEDRPTEGSGFFRAWDLEIRAAVRGS